MQCVRSLDTPHGSEVFMLWAFAGVFFSIVYLVSLFAGDDMASYRLVAIVGSGIGVTASLITPILLQLVDDGDDWESFVQDRSLSVNKGLTAMNVCFALVTPIVLLIIANDYLDIVHMRRASSGLYGGHNTPLDCNTTISEDFSYFTLHGDYQIMMENMTGVTYGETDVVIAPLLTEHECSFGETIYAACYGESFGEVVRCFVEAAGEEYNDSTIPSLINVTGTTNIRRLSSTPYLNSSLLARFSALSPLNTLFEVGGNTPDYATMERYADKLPSSTALHTLYAVSLWLVATLLIVIFYLKLQNHGSRTQTVESFSELVAPLYPISEGDEEEEEGTESYSSWGAEERSPSPEGIPTVEDGVSVNSNSQEMQEMQEIVEFVQPTTDEESAQSSRRGGDADGEENDTESSFSSFSSIHSELEMSWNLRTVCALLFGWLVATCTAAGNLYLLVRFDLLSSPTGDAVCVLCLLTGYFIFRAVCRIYDRFLGILADFVKGMFSLWFIMMVLWAIALASCDDAAYVRWVEIDERIPPGIGQGVYRCTEHSAPPELPFVTLEGAGWEVQHSRLDGFSVGDWDVFASPILNLDAECVVGLSVCAVHTWEQANDCFLREQDTSNRTHVNIKRITVSPYLEKDGILDPISEKLPLNTLYLYDTNTFIDDEERRQSNKARARYLWVKATISWMATTIPLLVLLARCD